jgi:hypothetical protein
MLSRWVNCSICSVLDAVIQHAATQPKEKSCNMGSFCCTVVASVAAFAGTGCFHGLTNAANETFATTSNASYATNAA